MLKKLHRNTKGSVLIYSIVLYWIVLLFFMLTIDGAMAFFIKNNIRDKLDASAEASSMITKPLYLNGVNEVVIDKAGATNAFYAYLKHYLNLDDSLYPKSDKPTLITGQVVVKEFFIYDLETKTDGPNYTCPRGEVYAYPTVHVEVEVPLKLIFSEVFSKNNYITPFHIDASNEEI